MFSPFYLLFWCCFFVCFYNLFESYKNNFKKGQTIRLFSCIFFMYVGCIYINIRVILSAFSITKRVRTFNVIYEWIQKRVTTKTKTMLNLPIHESSWALTVDLDIWWAIESGEWVPVCLCVSAYLCISISLCNVYVSINEKGIYQFSHLLLSHCVKSQVRPSDAGTTQVVWHLLYLD